MLLELSNNLLHGAFEQRIVTAPNGCGTGGRTSARQAGQWVCNGITPNRLGAHSPTI
jgi:hypothetical protein